MEYIKKGWSDESRRKIGDRSIGNKYAVGHKQTEEAKQKNREAHLGKKGCIGRIVSDETRMKISNANRGRIVPEEERRKMRIARANRIFDSETRRKIGDANRKRVWTDESRAKASISLKGKYAGENSPHWKGGITSVNERLRKSPEYKKWRLSVFERDDYTCFMCNTRGGHLHAHHIRTRSSNPDLMLDVNNGITLCSQCHRKTFFKEDDFINQFDERMIMDLSEPYIREAENFE